jgi:hypothetical protein
MHESTLSSDATELQASMGRNFQELQIGLEDPQRKELGGLAFTVAEAAILRNAGFETDGDSSPSRHTVAYYESPDGEFPRFGMRPMGLMFRMAGAMGLPGLRFADQPEFSKQYLVLATEALGAQRILGRTVRDWLLAHPGMNIEAGGTGVMVYRSGDVLQAGDVDGFVRDAAQLLGLVEHARRMAASLKPPTELEELRAFGAQLPAHMLRAAEKEYFKRRVLQADMDAFLRQGLPRKIPKNIAYSYQFSMGLAGFGIFFAVGAVAIAYGALVTGQLVGFVMLTIALAIASPMIYFGVPRFRRERGLLLRGEVTEARILGLESTGTTENDQEIYKVRVRYEVGGQSRKVECRAWGKPAKRIAAEGRPVRILYDPALPEKILLADALVNSEGEEDRQRLG